MKSLLNNFKAATKLTENVLGFSNYLARRSKLSFQVEVNWKKPQKYRVYHPEASGDLELMPDLKTDTAYGLFKNSKELENADTKVKNIFSLKYQGPRNRLRHYRREMVKTVRNHPYDYKSTEVVIAWLTSTVRSLIRRIEEAKNRKKRKPLIIEFKRYRNERQRQLELLREKDYKKFEWILEQLNIIYRPKIPVEEHSRSRKKSLMKLVQLKQERVKEENLAKLKKSLDEQKIPFLEKKIQKLKWIKETEEKKNLPKTVSDADIESCMKRLQEVKIEVAENQERGYKRDIHPYFIEPYYDKLLREKEKSGELIREPEAKNELVEGK